MLNRIGTIGSPAPRYSWSEEYHIGGNIWVCRDITVPSGRPEWFVVYRSRLFGWETLQMSEWTRQLAEESARGLVS